MKWLSVPKHASLASESRLGRRRRSGKSLWGPIRRSSSFVSRARSPVRSGSPLIVRQYSPPVLLGGGRVLTPQAKLRKRGEQARVVAATDPSEAVFEAIGDTVQGTSTDEVCRMLGKTPQSLGTVFEKLLESGRVLGFAGQWFQAPAFETGSNKFLSALEAAHKAEPLKAYLPREKVVAAAGLKWAGKPLDRIVSHLAARGVLEANGTTVKAQNFKVQLTPRQREFLDRTVLELGKEPVNTPGVHDLARVLGAPHQAVEEVLKLGVQAREVVAMGEGVFYTPAQLDALKARLRDLRVASRLPQVIFGTRWGRLESM